MHKQLMNSTDSIIVSKVPYVISWKFLEESTSQTFQRFLAPIWSPVGAERDCREFMPAQISSSSLRRDGKLRGPLPVALVLLQCEM
ncbi:hypothetical protein TNCV_1541751 [Trichonephila clavipes]|nr:hypothetical protein TNCV_1541751 [Trichonephila clavipes]